MSTTTTSIENSSHGNKSNDGGTPRKRKNVSDKIGEDTKKKKSSPPKEKRLKKFRSKAPMAVQQRIDRAMSQRMYLVHRDQDCLPTGPEGSSECQFVVLGSTGNVYTVRIRKIPHCTCPDHDKGNLCKHIIFVFLKVIGLPPNSNLIFQAALLSTELDEIFQTLRDRRVGGTGGGGGGGNGSGGNNAQNGVLANERVRSTYARLKQGEEDQDDSANAAEVVADVADIQPRRRTLEEDADCPICFDLMANDDPAHPLTFCRAMCGANFHAHCVDRWIEQNRRVAPCGHSTCPNCREPWRHQDASSDEKKKASSSSLGDEGYTNLGALQGVSSERDTSTYSEGYLYYSGSRW